jgi:hypothetical protein
MVRNACGVGRDRRGTGNDALRVAADLATV